MPKLKSGLVSFSVVFACGSLGMISSCGKDDDEKKSGTGGPTAAFLKETDFTATKLSEVTETDLKGNGDSSVNNIDDLKRSIDADTSSSPDASTVCIFGGSTYSVSNKSTVTFSSEGDAAACLQKASTADNKDLKVTVTKAKFKFFLQLSCEGADLSSLNGKKITETGDFEKIAEEQCDKATKRTLISNLEADTEYTFTNEGKEVKQGNLRLTATMQADGTPCTKTRNDTIWIWGDGCGSYDKSLTTSAETPDLVGTALLKVVKFTGVKELNDKTSPYFSEGKASIDINGWKGEAVFAGTTQAPSWSLKKGDVTVTGVYAPPAEKKE